MKDIQSTRRQAEEGSSGDVGPGAVQDARPSSRLGRVLAALRRHKLKVFFGAAFFVLGIVSFGGFSAALEETNSLSFCISCHEMKDTVYQEYKKSTHYRNPVGVRATCPDCHVPRPWYALLGAKIAAANDLYQTIIGTMNTPAKFEAHRLEMAEKVWKRMKETNSRECRNCHRFTAMELDKQPPRARGMHTSAIKDGSTCIDCHKGITHKDVSKLLEKDEPAPSNFDIQ